MVPARFGEGVDRREAALRTGARRAGVALHRVGTDADVVATLVDALAQARRPVHRPAR